MRLACRIRPLLSLFLTLGAVEMAQGAPMRSPTITVTDNTTLPGVFTSEVPAGGSIVVKGYSTLQYDGEGYVVGEKNGNVFTPWNLTTYNGLPYIINDKFGPSRSDRITMEFSFPIYSISFDYQIFPNANVANGTDKDPATTPGWPDFTFKADGELVFRALGVMPGQEGAPYTSSKNKKVETAPQLVASSGIWYFPDGVTKLEFIDWPPVIGVNNIQFNFGPFNNPPSSNLPEPGSLAAMCACALGAWWVTRRRRD
jgi:hypothetical protein